LYGGAARGGKSDALLMGAAQFAEVPGYSALLLRENFPDLAQADGLIPRSKQWWLNSDAKWHESQRRWTFPSGATITFGYLDSDDAVYQYQGAQFQFIGIDELTQHTEFRYRYLFSRLSRPKEGPLSTIPLRMRAGTNPGGRGHEWVKKRFIDSKIRDKQTIFVSAKLEDNPSTDQDEYEKSVANVDPLTRQQLRHGDWDAIEGGRFKRDWFRWYRRDSDFYLSPAWRFLPQHRPIFFTIDFASSAKQTADFTVIAVWMLSPTNDLLWIDCVRVQKETPDLVPLVQRLVRQYRPLFVGVEAVGSNNALLQFLQRSQDPVMTVMQLNPMGADKLVRATPAMVRVSEGRVYLPEDNPLFPLDEVMSELCRFTGDAKKDGNDDVVDTLSYACELLPRIANLDNSAVPTQYTPRGNLATGARPASSLPVSSSRPLPLPKSKPINHPLHPAIPVTQRLRRSR